MFYVLVSNNQVVFQILYSGYAAAIADNWQKDNDTQDTAGGQGVCPDGWHLPTDAEWTELEDYLEKNIAGGRMKEIGTTHWNSPNNDATNLSEFSALPSGYRSSYDGMFNLIFQINFFL